MKTITRILLIAAALFTVAFLTASCDDDDKDDQKDIIGTWKLDRYKVNAEPKAGSTMDKEQLEAALANYIFFTVNSQVTFTNTNVTLTPNINGEAQESMTFTYVVNKGTLTINLPLDNIKAIQGELDIYDDRSFEFDLDDASYMQLLNVLADADPDFKAVTDNIADANVEYHFSRIK